MVKGKIAKNFNKRGFTTWGLTNYGCLRSKGISSEKAASKLIREDKSRKNAITFRQRMKDK